MLISVKEYAARLGKEPSSIRRKILRGNLPAIKVGNQWCIEESTPYEDYREKEHKKDRQ